LKDLSATGKIAILVVLLLSFAAIVGRFVVAPSAGPPVGVVTPNDGDVAEKIAAPAPASLNPPVPPVLPDLNDGYLFNRERNFEEVDLGAAGSGRGEIDLAEVSYDGSWVVGEVPRGLITYQEKSPVARRPAAVLRRGVAPSQRSSAPAAARHKQLTLGENFMGYIVMQIEKDRIVFKKGEEVVEKFLYDQKNRAAVDSAAKSSPAGLGRPLPETVEQNPVPRQASPARNIPRKNGVGQAGRRVLPAARGVAPAARERNFKSEMLLGLDPSLGAAPSGDAPGDPLRR
jgi:hypothetical protein